MSPPGGIRGGNGVGILPPSGGSLPSPASSLPPSAALPNHPLDGKNILIVFNPAAQDGTIARELPELEKTLREAGAHVESVETLPDEAGRREAIAEAARRMLQRPGEVYLIPWGGDGTVGEAEFGTLRAAGIDLAAISPDPVGSIRFQERIVLVLADKGTYSDRAVIVKAPCRPAEMPEFISRGIRLPYRPPIIQIESPKNIPGGLRHEVAGHSFALGVGGYLFALRQRNKQKNPEVPLQEGLDKYILGKMSRGRLSYLRLLFPAIFSRYALLGVDVEMTHYDGKHEILRHGTHRGTEIMVAPNRIIAGYGGVPGAWGDVKLMVLPPGPRGILGLLEVVGRGVFTKYLGFNRVGPLSQVLTLPQERQILIRPGEDLEVNLKVPHGLDWDSLRLAQEGLIQTGLGNPKDRVPAAGEAFEVPAIKDGDVEKPVSRFTVRVPRYHGTLLADPRSLAVHWARETALAEGNPMPVTDHDLISRIVPDAQPEFRLGADGSERVRTHYLSLDRLDALLGKFRLPSDKVPELLAAVKSDQGTHRLSGLVDPKLSVEQLEKFLESQEGQDWRQRRSHPGTALGQRLLQGGVPLGLGMAALYGAEQISDALGLNPIQDPELRFALAVYLAHGVHVNTAPLWEVTANRLLGRPYDWVRMDRPVRLWGETFQRFHFESHRSLARGLASSWTSGAWAMEAGASEALWWKGAKTLGLPLTAAWNMGHGLIFSRLAENLLQDLPEDSALRRYSPMAAFFLPDAGRVVAPRSFFHILENRPLRWTARVFAAGFIADMAFSGLQHGEHGAGAGHERKLNATAAELRRRESGASPFSWRHALHFLSPTLADHIDSHAYGFGAPNVYHRLAEKI